MGSVSFAVVVSRFMGLGVMSAVQLTDARHAAPVRWGFDDQDLALLKLAALAVSQAMERAFLAAKLRG